MSNKNVKASISDAVANSYGTSLMVFSKTNNDLTTSYGDTVVLRNYKLQSTTPGPGDQSFANNNALFANVNENLLFASASNFTTMLNSDGVHYTPLFMRLTNITSATQTITAVSFCVQPVTVSVITNPSDQSTSVLEQPVGSIFTFAATLDPSGAVWCLLDGTNGTMEMDVLNALASNSQFDSLAGVKQLSISITITFQNTSASAASSGSGGSVGSGGSSGSSGSGGSVTAPPPAPIALLPGTSSTPAITSYTYLMNSGDTTGYNAYTMYLLSVSNSSMVITNDFLVAYNATNAPRNAQNDNFGNEIVLLAFDVLNRSNLFGVTGVPALSSAIYVAPSSSVEFDVQFEQFFNYGYGNNYTSNQSPAQKMAITVFPTNLYYQALNAANPNSFPVMALFVYKRVPNNNSIIVNGSVSGPNPTFYNNFGNGFTLPSDI